MDRKLRAVLEQIESHGELRDTGGTRYQQSVLLAPAIRRQLVAWEESRGKYALTPAGRQRLVNMRAGAWAWPIGLRSAMLIGATLGATGLATAGLYVSLVPLGGRPQPTRTEAPIVATAPSTPPKTEQPIVPPDAPAGVVPNDGGQLGAVEPTIEPGQEAAKVAGPAHRLRGSAHPQKRNVNMALSNFPLFWGRTHFQARRANGWTAHSAPYHDDRYSGSRVR